MGWFSNDKCPIHGIEYKIGKGYMCQQYYYCPKCNVKAQKTKDLEKRIGELEKKLQANK